MKHIATFFRVDDAGAMTVDWVVLTAAIVGLGMVVLIPIAYSTDSSATQVSGFINGSTVGYPGD